jgi:type IV pilus assembly protein PilB
MGLFEIMRITERIRQLVLEHASMAQLRQAAVEEGLRTLRDSGLAAVFDGMTTVEEVVRETMLM